MGIPNFTLLLKSEKSLKNFDSVLIDAQSLLYVAIEYSLKEKESDFISDIGKIVVAELGKILTKLFNTKKFANAIEVVISFDGEGVPMKFPTQRNRRKIEFKGRNVYRISLFGKNKISRLTYNYLVTVLQNFKLFRRLHLRCVGVPDFIRFKLSGCNLEGEGEHKLFHLGKNCKNPVIVSEDNDIFILSYLHYANFDTIQVTRKSNEVFDLNANADLHLKYNPRILVLASLLFGNDFIPPVLSISENNPDLIHAVLGDCKNCDLVLVFNHVLQSFRDKHKIHYSKVPYLDFEMIVEFFKTCIWMLDYYTFAVFPQKYMENKIFNRFDRNSVVTALLDLDYSQSAYETAEKEYYKLITTPQSNSIDKVFNREQFSIVSRFFDDNYEEGGLIIEVKCQK